MLRSSVPSVVALGTVHPDDSEDGVLSRKFLGMVLPGGAFNVQFYYRFSVSDPVTKFTLEPTKCGGGLVNVRCYYNNLYWSSGGARIQYHSGHKYSDMSIGLAVAGSI